MPALAQPTVCTFTGAATDTNYTDYGSGTSGFVNVGGPPGGANASYFRLCASGVGSTNWNVAFDQTDPNPITSLQLDVDFSIGGTKGAGNYADGMGIAFIPSSVYGTTGNGPSIVGEGDATFDGSISIGLDTFDNGNGQGSGFDLSNNAISINFNSSNVVYHYVSDLNPFNYQTHQDTQSASFDHLTAMISIDPAGGGATVTVTITSNQTGNAGDPPGNVPSPTNRGGPGTTVTPGTSFTPINGVVIPGVAPYAMRLA
jgi:hypothetical protein